MANEMTVRLPSFSKHLDIWFQRLAFIDQSGIEGETGIPVDIKVYAQAVGVNQLVYCAWRAQRDRLAEAKDKEGNPAPQAETLENLLGGPITTLEGGNKLRRTVTTFWQATRRQSQYVVEVRVMPGNPELEPFERFLQAAIEKIVKEDRLVDSGQPLNIPTYKAVAIGRGDESDKGHSRKLQDVLDARRQAARAAKKAAAKTE